MRFVLKTLGVFALGIATGARWEWWRQRTGFSVRDWLRRRLEGQ